MSEGSPGERLKREIRLFGMRPEWQLPKRRKVDLAGKRVLITGASSGIGEAGALKLAAEGAEVILVARRLEMLKEVAERITGQGGKATAINANLADLYAVDDLIDVVGPVDILINNAARSIRRPLADSLERWHDVERIMDLNYYSPLRLIRGLAPGMIERGEGHIVNAASWRVLPEASPLFGPYIASKAALSAVSRVIETEWGHLGVHSTTLYYPLVATPMVAATNAYEGVPSLTADQAADWILKAARNRPVRIAPRMAVAAKALDVFAPKLLNRLLTSQPKPSEDVLAEINSAVPDLSRPASKLPG